jgi:cell division ATPase FtsA
MKINMTNELNDIHKKSLKEEIMDEIIEILIRKLLEIVKQNVQDELKQYKTPQTSQTSEYTETIK